MKIFSRALFILLSVFAFINSFIDKNNFDFNYTQWLFNYEFEFIKRGFIGEILRIVNIAPSHLLVYFFSYILFFLILFLYIKLFYIPLRENQKKSGLTLFFLLIVFHSASLQHLNYDIARFDHFGLLIFLFMIWAIPRLTKTLQMVAVLSLLSVLILIHEASFVIFVPVIFAYWLYTERGNISLNLIRSAAFLFLAALTFYISASGSLTSISFDEYFKYLRLEYGNGISEEAVLVLFRDIGGNLSFSGKTGFSFNHHLLMSIIMIPTLAVLGFIFLDSLKKDGAYKTGTLQNNIVKTIFILSAFTPLVLYPIGIDYFRWWSLALTNLFIVFSVLLKEDSFKDSLSKIFTKYREVIIFIIVFSIVMGPLGNTMSFSNPLARSLTAFTGFRLFLFLSGILLIGSFIKGQRKTVTDNV